MDKKIQVCMVMSVFVSFATPMVVADLQQHNNAKEDYIIVFLRIMLLSFFAMAIV